MAEPGPRRTIGPRPGGAVRVLWLRNLISEAGSAMSALAIPLVAVASLDATPFQVGLLAAASTVAFAVVSLPAGVLVDRVSRVRVLQVADTGRALVLAAVVAAAWLDRLSLPVLYVAALGVGTMTVAFDTASQSLVPDLVPGDRLIRTNGALAIPGAVVRSGGPAAAGALVAVAGAVWAIVADAVSYAVSALLALTLTEPGRAVEARRERWGAAILEGLRVIVRHPGLRSVILGAGTANFFISAQSALLVLFFARVAGFSELTIGLVYGAGGIGAVTAGLAATRLSDRWGPIRLMWLPRAVLGWSALAIPLVNGPSGAWVAGLSLAATNFVATLASVGQVSYRQSIAPRHMLGRVNASARWVVWGAIPAGAFVGGAAAELVGPQPTLVVCALGAWASVLIIVRRFTGDRLNLDIEPKEAADEHAGGRDPR